MDIESLKDRKEFNIVMLGGSFFCYNYHSIPGVKKIIKELEEKHPNVKINLLNLSLSATDTLQNLSELILNQETIAHADFVITNSNSNDIHAFKASRYSLSYERLCKNIEIYYTKLYQIIDKKRTKVLSWISAYNHPCRTIVNNIHRYYNNKFGFNCLDDDLYYNYPLDYVNVVLKDNLSTDYIHELQPILSREIYNAFGAYDSFRLCKENVECDKIPNVVVYRPEDFKKNGEYSVLDSKGIFVQLENNSHYSLIEITDSPLYFKEVPEVSNRKIMGVCLTCKPTEKLPPKNFYQSYILESDKNGVVKFVSPMSFTYPAFFEHILSQKGVYVSSSTKLLLNSEDKPLTERSWIEISGNIATKNTRNSKVYLFYVLAIDGFDEFKSSFPYSLEWITNNQISVQKDLLRNDLIPDLSLLYDVLYAENIKPNIASAGPFESLRKTREYYAKISAEQIKPKEEMILKLQTEKKDLSNELAEVKTKCNNFDASLNKLAESLGLVIKSSAQITSFAEQNTSNIISKAEKRENEYKNELSSLKNQYTEAQKQITQSELLNKKLINENQVKQNQITKLLTAQKELESKNQESQSQIKELSSANKGLTLENKKNQIKLTESSSVIKRLTNENKTFAKKLSTYSQGLQYKRNRKMIKFLSSPYDFFKDSNFFIIRSLRLFADKNHKANTSKVTSIISLIYPEGEKNLKRSFAYALKKWLTLILLRSLILKIEENKIQTVKNNESAKNTNDPQG